LILKLFALDIFKDKKIYGAYLEKYFLEAKVESADEWINQQ